MDLSSDRGRPELSSPEIDPTEDSNRDVSQRMSSARVAPREIPRTSFPRMREPAKLLSEGLPTSSRVTLDSLLLDFDRGPTHKLAVGSHEKLEREIFLLDGLIAFRGDHVISGSRPPNYRDFGFWEFAWNPPCSYHRHERDCVALRSMRSLRSVVAGLGEGNRVCTGALVAL